MTQLPGNKSPASVKLPASSRGLATGLGFASVILWGTSIAVNRLLVQELGLLQGPLISTAISGTAGIVLLALRRGEMAKLRRLPALFWAVCGGLFVAYTLSYNLGVGLARNGRQLLLFGILNYLWPVLTVAFSAALFRRRIRPWFFAGIAAAIAAVVLAFLSRPATAGDAAISLGKLAGDLRDNPVLYALGLFCGVAWALYSNLGRRIAGSTDANPVPLFFVAASAFFAVAWLAGAGTLMAGAGRPVAWDAGAVGVLAYRALFVDLAAYTFWDAAMRRGSQVLVAAASIFTPLLSTAAIALMIRQKPGALFWVACAVAVIGAALCRYSVGDNDG